VHDALQSALEIVLRLSPWLSGQRTTAAPSHAPTGQAYRERIAAAAQASLQMPSPSPYVHQSNSLPSHRENANIREPAEAFKPEIVPGESQGYFSSLAVIGQFHAEYILCQSGAELVIIDQHAASERVAYQRLKQQCRAGGVESQRLLFPETVELSFSEAAAALRFQADLALIGFELEPFGGTTIIISAVPRLTEASAGTQLVKDILGELNQLDTSAAFQDAVDDLLSRIACHSVVRGVRPLDILQITELLRSMDETDFAASCPHGRPVSHTITLVELEKIFKRR
jgi:DNA mismatch repair protein MutL